MNPVPGNYARRAIVLAALTFAVAAGTAFAYKELRPPERVVLPTSRSPEQSLASVVVPADLAVELVAAEPLVMDPIDLAWGADGRLWVVEMADYPQGLDGKGKPGGRIRFLESTGRDGRYDKSTLFADGLSFPTSVKPWRNGVLVVSVPDILFLEDTDGDGRADRTTKLFTGLGEGNQQHLVNGLQWALDGWLHLANGNSGGKVSALNHPERVVELGQRDFRVFPDDGGIELLEGQSQFGRNRDDWGNWFGCNNSNPIWHYALADRYLRRNPQLVAPNATVTVASVPGAARIYPRSETLARFNDPQGFNHFTSACGVMIYRDDFLGSGYSGNAFVCEPVHNLVHREIVRPAGTTFRSERAAGEETSEFLASTDAWSRFTSVRAGPDGALYIVDMYRLVIEHPKWIPDAWQKEIGDLRAGEKQGRIYRVRPKGRPLRPAPRLDRAETGELVAALASPSGLVRDLAQEQLTWRKEQTAAPALEDLVVRASRPETRAQALWTLATIGSLQPEIVGRALEDSHPGVRCQAVRLSETFAREPRGAGLLPRLISLVHDPDARVRLQLGGTLGEWRQPAAGVALAQLLRADTDRFVHTAAMSSALPHADAIIAHLRAEGRGDDPLLIEVAAVTGNAAAFEAILNALATARRSSDVRHPFASLARLLDWLQQNNKSLVQLQSVAGESLRTGLAAVDEIFAAARKLAVDPATSTEDRIAAANVLGRGRTQQSEDVDILIDLLAPRSPVELQLAAVAALGRINRPAIGERVLAGWNAQGPTVRAAVFELATSRPAWAQALLDRIESDRAMRAQINAAQRVALTQHANSRVAERAAAIFEAGTDRNRQNVIDRYLAAVNARPGDALKGATVFAAVCSTCHRFGATPGRQIGPDLASVKDRSATYLITHILDPNRAVEERYLFYSATTQDGRTLSGVLANESGNSVTLVGLDGAEQVVLRSALRSLGSTGRSLMPEGLESAVDEQAMADLVTFLAGAQEKR